MVFSPVTDEVSFPPVSSSTPISGVTSSSIASELANMSISASASTGQRPISPQPAGSDSWDSSSLPEPESDSEADGVQLPPQEIQTEVKDFSRVPLKMLGGFRRIRPIPAGLTPPRMPRITNYTWGAGDWEAAAGVGETIHTDSSWSSIEDSVISDLIRPIASFADIRLASPLNPFVDFDSAEDDIQSVDSYGRPLTPIHRDEHERGRARPGARPPGTRPAGARPPGASCLVNERKGILKVLKLI